MTPNRILHGALIAAAVFTGAMAIATPSHAVCLSPVTVHDPSTPVLSSATKGGAKRSAQRTWKDIVHNMHGRQFRNLNRATNVSGFYRATPDGRRWVYTLTATPCD